MKPSNWERVRVPTLHRFPDNVVQIHFPEPRTAFAHGQEVTAGRIVAVLRAAMRGKLNYRDPLLASFDYTVQAIVRQAYGQSIPYTRRISTGFEKLQPGLKPTDFQISVASVGHVEVRRGPAEHSRGTFGLDHLSGFAEVQKLGWDLEFGYPTVRYTAYSSYNIMPKAYWGTTHRLDRDRDRLTIKLNGDAGYRTFDLSRLMWVSRLTPGFKRVWKHPEAKIVEIQLKRLSEKLHFRVNVCGEYDEDTLLKEARDAMPEPNFG